MRKNYSGKLKAKMAIDMIREQETVAELSSKYGHPSYEPQSTLHFF